MFQYWYCSDLWQRRVDGDANLTRLQDTQHRGDRKCRVVDDQSNWLGFLPALLQQRVR
jgi:hypothetical protein